ncbi:hypothetical protein S7711_10751 [Stachybotrys chartarum IBT 7711]|uniref:Uncharacterized protein n=1 Tax=Stachybotrys chartarum (strain CBS 109288 / IBT 7711) TaxID=1280523 RepID=A0A084B7L1_STACB|nr:hypothetical protein S7711_10751 [Stachybotrys chartarum IBT 7711]
MNHYLALIETSLQTKVKARPRPLLLENVFNQSTSSTLALFWHETTSPVTDNKGQLPLHIAVKYGLEKVCTQIVSAIQRGLLVVVESLLAANIDPNIYDSQGVTPILLASSQGKVKISEALLPAGANATVTDPRGWLPKDYAAYHDHLELAQKLPGRGSSVIHADLGKKTPARTILPVRPPGDSVIFVNIRTLDLRKGDVVGIDLPPYKSK